MFKDVKVIILGAGDTGTAVAIRLFNSGFRPVLVERNNPTDMNFFRNFSDVVYLGEKTIADVKCKLYHETSRETDFVTELDRGRMDRLVPAMNEESFLRLSPGKSDIVIDCRGSSDEPDKFDWHEYACFIRIGGSYQVGRDGHVVIGATGHDLGRVVRKPEEMEPASAHNTYISNAPIEGVFISKKEAGDEVSERDEIGTIDDISILSPRDGRITGILHSGHFVHCRQSLFEVKPKNMEPVLSRQISVQCLAVAGGVLEAVLQFEVLSWSAAQIV